jgi:putative thioredoxin
MSPIDFQAAVLERSREIPVVVDFWAPWCAPCRTLGPAIEELAAADAGRWELVKLDTDEQPEIAQRYGIQGIPAVKLFIDARVTAEFVGALTRSEIRGWIDSNLPDPRAGRLASIMTAWEERGPQLATDLEAYLRENPDQPEAGLRLAQVVVAHDPSRARELIEDGSYDAELTELAADIGALAELAQIDTDPLPTRLAEPFGQARQALMRHDLDATLERLVEAAMVDRAHANQLARRAAVALFHLLGPDHALARDYQRRLATALLS